MGLRLKSHIVAFIDVLGFSAMVSHDCERPHRDRKYIESLYEIHNKTKEITKELPGMAVTQFSDSVVLSVPYSVDNFHAICRIISDFQFNLLSSGILCRGGVSYGKHFSTEDFIFSHGLIDAYHIESMTAINPRVVISKNLIELVFGDAENIDSDLILMESDGQFFVEYLNAEDAQGNKVLLSQLIPDELSQNPSIRSKQIWLIDYFNIKYPEDVFREICRFQSLSA